MRTAIFSIAALFALAEPTLAQDFLKPLQELVEEFIPRAEAPPRPPVSASHPAPVALLAADGALTPPMPRPRPQALQLSVEASADGARDETTEPQADKEADAAASGRVYQIACPALLAGLVVGEMQPPIAEGVCTERSPLLITAVRANGREVPFSSPVTTNCAMAGALADWVAEIDLYANAALDSPLAQLDSGTSMMCRERNGGGSEFVSEHGFANALDVIGVTLADGRVIAVEQDWLPASAPAGRLLRQAHGAACARFTTVLGPEANDEHEDHLHVDLGCHGARCTAQICE